MKFVLAGNPNSGKTTLFNVLTGGNARVGNWPGVTVDKKEGAYSFKHNGAVTKIGIVDLPGIYSLSPYSPEEIVALRFITDEKPDLIVNVIDSTNLERNLYLTTQLVETDVPVVAALNMIDVIEREGSQIDTEALSLKLGIPVVPVSALRSNSVHRLMQSCVECAGHPRKGTSFLSDTVLGERYENALRKVGEGKHAALRAVKLLESETDCANDCEAEIADLRYRFITEEVKPAAVRLRGSGGRRSSEKIDGILTHRLWGLPIFFATMFVIFHIVFAGDLLFLERTGAADKAIPGPGAWLQGCVEDFGTFAKAAAGRALETAGASEAAKGVIADGLVNGLCSVLSFLPQIMLLFFFLSLLEDSGYMSRIAFITDRAMRRFGLSGRAILPMLTGFGCSVPAIMSTRTLENVKEKRLTLMLIPFFSCSAKTGVWTVIVAAFFPGNADSMVFLVFLVGVAAAVCGAVLLKHTVFGKLKSNFVLELPVYRAPRLGNILKQLWYKLRGFVLQVTTVIAAATVLIWFLQNFDLSLHMVASEDGARSILGVIGNSMKWIFEPLGFAGGEEGWKPVVAILTGFIAKEAVVSAMGVLYIPSYETVVGDDTAKLATALAALSVFTPESAFSFMVFNLLTIPCFAAVATAYAEMKSARLFAFAVAFWISAAWLTSFAVYRAGLLLKEVNVADAMIFLFVASIVLVAVFRGKNKKGKGKEKEKNKCGGCTKCRTQ